MFAPSPTFFANAADLRPTEAKVQEGHSTYKITNHGLHITFPCIVIDQNRVEAILNCTSSGREYVGVWLERSGPKTYMRLPSNQTRISEEEFQDAKSVTMYIVEECMPLHFRFCTTRGASVATYKMALGDTNRQSRRRNTQVLRI